MGDNLVNSIKGKNNNKHQLRNYTISIYTFFLWPPKPIAEKSGRLCYWFSLEYTQGLRNFGIYMEFFLLCIILLYRYIYTINLQEPNNYSQFPPRPLYSFLLFIYSYVHRYEWFSVVRLDRTTQNNYVVLQLWSRFDSMAKYPNMCVFLSKSLVPFSQSFYLPFLSRLDM